MKKLILVAALGVALTLPLRAGAVASFADIQVWAGAGASAANRAALVLQWNINAVSYSYAWGFGWNSGTPTGRDMLLAVDAADARLSVDYTQSAVFGMFYDLNNNGSSYTPGVPGIVDYGNPDNTIHDTPGLTEAGDIYQSGWADGFWNYSISGGNFTYFDYFAGANATYASPGSTTYSGVTWDVAPVGDTSRELVDGSWDSFSFSTDVINYTSPSVVQPLAAVPEPSPALLTAFSIGLLLYARRRLHSC